MKLEWLVDIEINNKVIEFKIDSGAQVNCISERLYSLLEPRPKIIKKDAVLRG